MISCFQLKKKCIDLFCFVRGDHSSDCISMCLFLSNADFYTHVSTNFIEALLLLKLHLLFLNIFVLLHSASLFVLPLVLF